MSFASAGSGPIASAFVEVVADTRSADQTIDEFIRRMSRIDDAAAEAGAGVRRAFLDASSDSLRALETIQSGFTGVDDAAAQSAAGIDDAFFNAARSAAGAFTELARAAGRAGLNVAREIGSAITNGIRTAVRSAAEFISTTLTTAAATAGVGIAVSLTKGFQRLTTIQDSTAALAISLGDSAAAAQLLAEVLEVVRGTPFNLDQFARGAQILSAMGIEAGKIPGILTAIGEAAATQGGRANEVAERLIFAFGQVSSTGRIMGDDILAFSEVGVNALAILGNHFGVTTEEMRDMVSDGAVPAAEAIDVLADGIINGSTGIAGATVALGGTMENLRQTLSGSLGGLSAAFARFGASIIEPFSGALTTAFTVATEVIDAIGEQVKDLGTTFANSEFFKGLIEFLKAIPDNIGPVIEGLASLKDILIPIAGAGAGAALTAISSALGPLGALIPRISPLAGLLIGIVAASEPLRNAFFGLVERIVELGQGLFDQLQPALNTIMPLLEHFGTILIDRVGDALETIAPLIQPLADVLFVLLGAVLRIGKPILDLAITLLQVLVPVFQRLLPVIEQVAAILIGALAVALERLFEALEPVLPALGEALLAIVEALAPVLPELADAFEQIVIALVDLLVALLPLLPPLLELVTLFVQEIGAPVLLAIAQAVGFLAEKFAQFVDAVGIGLFPIASTVTQLIFLYQNVLVPLGQFLAGVFLPIFQSISDFFVSIWQDVLVPFGQFLQAVFVPIFQFLATIFSTLIVPALQILTTVLTFLWQNVFVPLGQFLQAAFLPVLELIIGAVAGPLLTAIGAAISIIIVLWQHVFVPLWGFLSRNFGPVLQFLASVFTGVVVPAVQGVIGVLQFLWRNVAIPVANFISGVFNAALGAFRTAWNTAKGAIDTARSALSTIYNNVIVPAANFIRNTFKPVIDGLKDAFRFLSGPINTAKSAIEGLIGVIQDAIGFIGDLIDKISNIDLPDLSPGFDIPGVPLFQGGGIGEFGAGTPAILHGREAILPLDDLRRSLQILEQSGLFATPSLSAGGDTNSFVNNVGDLNITVNVQGTADPGPIATATSAAVQRVLDRRGLEFTARVHG